MSEELDRYIARNRDELIESQKAYIARLEAAYLQLKEDQLHKIAPHDHYNDMITDSDIKKARESLERIKAGDTQ